MNINFLDSFDALFDALFHALFDALFDALCLGFDSSLCLGFDHRLVIQVLHAYHLNSTSNAFRKQFTLSRF